VVDYGQDRRTPPEPGGSGHGYEGRGSSCPDEIFLKSRHKTATVDLKPNESSEFKP
jgi:hypothetical protein